MTNNNEFIGLLRDAVKSPATSCLLFLGGGLVALNSEGIFRDWALVAMYVGIAGLVTIASGFVFKEFMKQKRVRDGLKKAFPEDVARLLEFIDKNRRSIKLSGDYKRSFERLVSCRLVRRRSVDIIGKSTAYYIPDEVFDFDFTRYRKDSRIPPDPSDS